MKIMVLGGTGAMGIPLVEMLADNRENVIYVTSRTEKTSRFSNVHFIKGNAMDEEFIKSIMEETEFDVIVDFMIYPTKMFETRAELLLDKTAHYIYFSSSRVYADSKEELTESSERLLDVCKDEKYLKTDEYALRKARTENYLVKSGNKNFTIIRPYVTCNYVRMQLGFYEKEQWLYRALRGKTIVFPEALEEKYTTITYARDVAKYLVRIIEINHPSGDVFNVALGDTITWGDVLKIYIEKIQDLTGRKVKIKLTKDIDRLGTLLGAHNQIKYDRMYDRFFNNKKVCEYTGIYEHTDINSTISECIFEFLESGEHYRNIVWSLEGYMDRLSGEWEPINKIDNMKHRATYLVYRILPFDLAEGIRKLMTPN